MAVIITIMDERIGSEREYDLDVSDNSARIIIPALNSGHYRSYNDHPRKQSPIGNFQFYLETNGLAHDDGGVVKLKDGVTLGIKHLSYIC